jgi:hypothetical protein
VLYTPFLFLVLPAEITAGVCHGGWYCLRLTDSFCYSVKKGAIKGNSPEF